MGRKPYVSVPVLEGVKKQQVEFKLRLGCRSRWGVARKTWLHYTEK